MNSTAMSAFREACWAAPSPIARGLRYAATASSEQQTAAATLQTGHALSRLLFEVGASLLLAAQTKDADLEALAEQALAARAPAGLWHAALAMLRHALAESDTGAFEKLRKLAVSSEAAGLEFREASEWLVQAATNENLQRTRWATVVPTLASEHAQRALRTVAEALRDGLGVAKATLVDVWPTDSGAAVVYRRDIGYLPSAQEWGDATGPLPQPGQSWVVGTEGGLWIPWVSFGPNARQWPTAASRNTLQCAPTVNGAERPASEWAAGGAEQLTLQVSPQGRDGWSFAWWPRHAAGGIRANSPLVLPITAEWNVAGVRAVVELPTGISLSERVSTGARHQARHVAAWLRDALAGALELAERANQGSENIALPGGTQIFADGSQAWFCPAVGANEPQGWPAGAWASRWLRALAHPEPALPALLRELHETADTAEKAWAVLEQGASRLASRVGGAPDDVVHAMASIQKATTPEPPPIDQESSLGSIHALAAAAYERWDAQERAEWMCSAARAFARAGSAGDAAAAWEAALDADPDRDDANAAVLEEAKTSGQLALALELALERAEASRTQGASAQREALVEAAALATELGQSERAMDLAKSLAALGGEDPDALADATRLATANRNWGAAARWALNSGDAALSEETAEHVLNAATGALEEGQPGLARQWAVLAAGLNPAMADRAELYRAMGPPEHAVQTSVPQTPAHRKAKLESMLEQANSDADRGGVLALMLSEAHAIGLSTAEVGLYQVELLKLRPQDPRLLEAVQSLRATEGNWREVERILERRQRLTDSADEQRAFALERARVLRRRLGSHERALMLLNELAQKYPRDMEVLDSLEEACRALSRWEPLVKTLTNKASLLEGSARATALVEAGLVAQNHLDSEGRAERLYREALAIAPLHTVASRELGLLLRQQGQPEAALPLLEMWSEAAAASGEAGRADSIAGRLALGEVAEQCGHLERALAAYESVLAIDELHADAVLAASRLHRELGQGAKAEGALSRLLTSASANLDERTRAEAERLLSDISLASGSLEESRAHLAAALRLDPRNISVLEDLIRVCDQMQRFEDGANYRMRLAELRPTAEGRFNVLMEAGDIARSRLGHRELAMTAYEAAHRARPDARAPLGTLVELYLSDQRYMDAAAALGLLTDIEPDSAKKAQNALATALLYRDHLSDYAQTAVFLERALEYDPLRLEAFEALDQLLAEQERYDGERAQAYERMIQRLSDLDEAEPILVRLLVNLGRLSAANQRWTQAEGAYRRALVLRPNDAEPWVRIGELYAAQDGRTAQALEAFQRALDLGSRDPDIFRAQGRIYARQRQADAAWCTCGVLCYLGAADEKESTYYSAHKTGALKVARTLRDAELWRRNIFPDPLVESLGTLFETLYQSMPQLFAKAGQGHARIRSASRVDLSERSVFAGFAATVPRIVGVPTPRYFRSTVEGIRKMAEPDPVLWVNSELVESGRGKPLRFALGRAVALFHESLWVYELLAPQDLQALLEAVYTLVAGGHSTGAHPAGLAPATPKPDNPWFASLDAVVPNASRPALAALAAPYFRGGSVPDVHRWAQLAQLTANRVGLLLCNDVEVAAEGIEQDPKPECGLTVDEQVWHLLRYAASEPYHALRAHMGIAVQ